MSKKGICQNWKFEKFDKVGKLSEMKICRSWENLRKCENLENVKLRHIRKLTTQEIQTESRNSVKFEKVSGKFEEVTNILKETMNRKRQPESQKKLKSKNKIKSLLLLVIHFSAHFHYSLSKNT